MKRVFAILNSTDSRTLACSAALALARLHFHGGSYSALDYLAACSPIATGLTISSRS